MGKLQQVVLDLKGQAQGLHHGGEILLLFSGSSGQDGSQHTGGFKRVAGGLQQVGSFNLLGRDPADIPGAKQDVENLPYAGIRDIGQ